MGEGAHLLSRKLIALYNAATPEALTMIPWLQIDSARVPGAEVELRLMRRGDEFSMKLGQNELMNSRLSGSEEALATLACRKIESAKRPHLLIGGLGMGFTLRAALAVLGTEARITVAELVPAVIAWAKGPLSEIFAGSLDDPRATVLAADVVEVIEAHAQAYDAILLDVDNGPEGLIRKANDALYDSKGLQAIRRALRPGGVLAVWSSGPHPEFSTRLRDAGFAVNEVAVRATARRRGARHVVWLATRAKAG
jgi:spermidine synthase